MVSYLETASTAWLPSCPSAPLDEPDLAFVNDVLALCPALQALAVRHQFMESTDLKTWLFTTIMHKQFNSRWRLLEREVTTGSEVVELAMVTPATQESFLWA